MSKQVNLNIDELKDFIGHIIANNRELQARGLNPVAVAVEGDSGIGKTSSTLQLAAELGLKCVKLNLAQIEELGDLVGFPIRQFQATNNTETLWIDEHAVDSYTKLGYKFTGQNQMSYCAPEWIANVETGGILILDDFNRADPRFMQATMELIDRQQYISWKLPKDWHIILSNNPDNGDYNVTSLDGAQKTRYISTYLKFDIDCWARWAEGQGIDSRCINFLLMHPELVTKETNARSITNFFNSISSLESFEKSLPLIQLIGEGSVGSEFANMFVLFINNKLDKLMSPKEMLFADGQDRIIKELKTSIGTGATYRADIASVIATRMVNYAVHYAADNSVETKLVDRIATIITEDVFTNDLKYNVVKGIFNGNKAKFKLLTTNKALVKFVLA